MRRIMPLIASLLLAGLVPAERPRVLLLPTDREGVTEAAAASIRSQVVRFLEEAGATVVEVPAELFPQPIRVEPDFVRARSELFARGGQAFAILILRDVEDPIGDVALLRLENVAGQVMELGLAGDLGTTTAIPEFHQRLLVLWEGIGNVPRLSAFLSSRPADPIDQAIARSTENPDSVILVLERRIATVEARLGELTGEQQANWRREFARVRRAAQLGRDAWAFSEFEKLMRARNAAPTAHVPADAIPEAHLQAYESLLSSIILWGGPRLRPAEMQQLLVRHREAVQALRRQDEAQCLEVLRAARPFAESVARDLAREHRNP